MKYIVRMEFDIDSIDFGDIEVEAESIEDAKQKAIDSYHKGNIKIDYYASNTYDSILRESDKAEWNVEEI